MAKTATLQPLVERYQSQVLPALKERFTYSSTYLIPKITKVVVNVGIGDFRENKKAMEDIMLTLTKITGQKPVMVKARKSIAGFKIREGMEVGIVVTLRGARMNDFVQKLISVSLPRTRDFRGIKETAVTADGNLNVGIKDASIFPEAPVDLTTFGIQVTVVSTARTRDEAFALYTGLGFPIQGHGNLS
jgi:large subunit ribosomal protein L5